MQQQRHGGASARLRLGRWIRRLAKEKQGASRGMGQCGGAACGTSTEGRGAARNTPSDRRGGEQPAAGCRRDGAERRGAGRGEAEPSSAAAEGAARDR
jgi:hypothetical protein